MGASVWLYRRAMSLASGAGPRLVCSRIGRAGIGSGTRLGALVSTARYLSSTAGPLDTPVLAQTTDRRLHAAAVGGGRRRTNLRCQDTRPLHDGREDFTGEHGASNKAGAASIPPGRCSRLQIFQWVVSTNRGARCPAIPSALPI